MAATRISDLNAQGLTDDSFLYIIMDLNIKKDQDLNSVLSIFRTIFVCFCLAGAAMTFVKDMNTIVLTPLENMVKKIETITENPINAAAIQEKEAFVWHTLYSNNKEALRLKEEQMQYETSQIEEIIVKNREGTPAIFGTYQSLRCSNIVKNGQRETLNPVVPTVG